jgi:hypothetical protein
LDFGLQVKNSSFRNPNLNRAALWRIFSVRQPIEKQGSSMQTVNEQAGGWIPFCMKRLRTLNSYQIFKIKN